MMVPSRRWLGGAVLLGLTAPIALVGPAGARFWLLADVFWVVALVVDAIRLTGFRWEGLTLEREGAGSFSMGRSLPVRYRWRNPTHRLTLWVRETPPATLTVAAQEPLDRILELGPDRDTVEERLLVPVRRGAASSWRFDLRAAGPWGFAWRQYRWIKPWSSIVYPRLREAVLKQLPSQSRRRQAGLRETRRLGEGRMFESLREWVPGDDTRIVDWKATARQGKLIARQYEDERRQQVMIAIDAGRLLTAEVQGRARLEDAIEAAAQLAHHVTSLDDDVGLMVFTDSIDHYTPPRRGQRALRAVLDILAAVEGKMVEPNYPAAFSYLAARTRKRVMTIVFTDIIDRFASEALAARLGGLRPRHVPVAVVLRDLGLERLVSTRPVDSTGAFERAAADELLQVRDEALAAMRAKGVVVVDTHPDAAAKAVVERYVQLKRRALV